MDVLFVCSGNRTGNPGPVVQNQAKSIEQAGNNVFFYLIKGKGVKGYYRNIKKLKKEIKNNHYDIIHSHGMSSIVATIALCKPHVVSLLGSEVLENGFQRIVFRLLSRFFWDKTIVKSNQLKDRVVFLKNKKIEVIPNGVDLKHFDNINRIEAKKELGFSLSKRTILFFADPSRKSKNFSLAQKTIELLSSNLVEFKIAWNIPYDQVPKYLFACDILLVTSLWEGSPNTVKEAMACNCPVVATNVGDIKWLFGKEPGYFLTGFNHIDISEKISKAIEFAEINERTKGRYRLEMLGLDSASVANKIITTYKSVI